jgi:tRNA-2-methylthio-N6-dimethylallyladenosine synthase
LEVQNAISLEDGRAQVGKIEEVLVEGLSKLSRKNPGAAAAALRQMTGRTSADRIVVFNGSERQVGQLLPVRIVDATPYALLGEVVVHELVGLTFPADNGQSSTIL